MIQIPQYRWKQSEKGKQILQQIQERESSWYRSLDLGGLLCYDDTISLNQEN